MRDAVIDDRVDEPCDGVEGGVGLVAVRLGSNIFHSFVTSLMCSCSVF